MRGSFLVQIFVHSLFFQRGVNYVDFSSPWNKFIKVNIIVNIIVVLPGHNGCSANVHIYQSFNDQDDVLVAVEPDLIIVSMGE